MEVGAHGADTSAKVDPTKDLDDESKAEWLKRRAKEERKHKMGLKVKEEWYEINAGKKLVKKLRKNNGGVYTLYVGNVKKKDVKDFLATLKKGEGGKYYSKGAV
jgi:hypothetical protein